ncbi:MAG: glycosyltransferase, partial [Clostridia bacterium]|nr:glycosyltransferase [Clostridia bacterium]
MLKVSVVIPCYNVEKYINQCIDSILAQTLTDFEIICVDDGSTDGTVDILRRYAEADSRVRIIEQKNQYAGVARNNGLAAAQGEYVIFLDSDDFFHPEMLEKTCGAADEAQADAVVFGFRRFDDRKQEFFPRAELPRRDLVIAAGVDADSQCFSATDVPNDIFRITSPAPWTKLFRRSFVEKTGLQFQALPNSNDFFFILSALSLAERITLVSEDLTYYRVNMSTSIQGSKHKNPLCFLEAIEGVKRHLVETDLYSVFEKAFTVIALSSSNYNLHSSTDEARKVILEAFSNPENPIRDFLGHDKEYYTIPTTYKHAYTINNAVTQYNIVKNTKQQALTQPVIPYRAEKAVDVSVIIPVYNTGDFLHATIDSICRQTLDSIEIICINDGSTDDSLDILKEWAEKDERISVWTQENAGLSCTRNSGVQIAQGKYVYFMDSDDILEDTALELLFRKSDKENLDIVYFDADVFSDDDDMDEEIKRFNYKRSKEYSEVYSGQDLLRIMYNNGEYFPSACLQMCRKDYIKENSFYFRPGVIHEDNAFTFASFINAERVSHINKPFFHRRLRANSIMTTGVSFKNAYGYFTSYLDMVKAYAAVEDRLSEENRAAAQSRVAQ